MAEPKSITATLAINTYALDVATVGSGTVAKSPDQPSYDHGSSVELTATPATGYHFVGWSGDATGSTNPLSVTMDAAKHIAASFAIDTYTITASAAANGTITPSGSVSVSHGDSQSFTITPNTGYHVADVLVDGGSAGAMTSYTFTNVTASHTIAASFAIDTYTITASAGANGAISPNGSVSVSHGDSQSFTITPNTGYHVADVLVDGGSAGAMTSYTFTNVTASHTIAASFAIDTYTITASAGANGAISPNGSVSVSHGD